MITGTPTTNVVYFPEKPNAPSIEEHVINTVRAFQKNPWEGNSILRGSQTP